MGSEKTTWQRIARRIRVPLGFVVAAVFVVFAAPSWHTLAWSLLLVVPGVWLRGYAAGYVKKNAELTVTGPYAFTRNPLYLGSMGIAFGFAVAAGGGLAGGGWGGAGLRRRGGGWWCCWWACSWQFTFQRSFPRNLFCAPHFPNLRPMRSG